MPPSYWIGRFAMWVETAFVQVTRTCLKAAPGALMNAETTSLFTEQVQRPCPPMAYSLPRTQSFQGFDDIALLNVIPGRVARPHPIPRVCSFEAISTNYNNTFYFYQIRLVLYAGYLKLWLLYNQGYLNTSVERVLGAPVKARNQQMTAACLP